MTETQTPQEFWEQRYQSMTKPPSGKPSGTLVHYVEGLTPGRALDLGSSRGDDVLWLAGQGWLAQGVDLSQTAVDLANARAAEAGLGERARFEQYDLTVDFPPGAFDLVSAMFLQSPMEFPRAEVLRKAVGAVAPGGVLIIAEHGSAAPWSDQGPHVHHPTLAQTQEDLQLDVGQWDEVSVRTAERQATGQMGQVAQVIDNILVFRRRPTA